MRAFRLRNQTPATVGSTRIGNDDIHTFATTLETDFEIIDLRNAPIGMGF
jgi:hypothetical protein